MFELLFAILAVFFGILGLTEVLHIIKMLILKPKKRPKRYLVCEIEKDCAKRQILSTAENFRWYGKGIADCVIFLSDGFTDDTKELCSFLSRNGEIFFCERPQVEECNGRNRQTTGIS